MMALSGCSVQYRRLPSTSSVRFFSVALHTSLISPAS